MLSMTTDYVVTTGPSECYLREIAEAGFTHVHWCQHYGTDFLYTEPEIQAIEDWLDRYGLKLLNLHASHGAEKNYGSVREYERLAGVELVKNRMEMTARLGADVIILHMPTFPEPRDLNEKVWAQMFRSLDELEAPARRFGVRIAVENGNFDPIGRILERYAPGFVGLCYDSGHGNVTGDGLERLEGMRDRLIAIHLHDNDGSGDQHRIPLEGTVDWERLMDIVARSSYAGCVSLESTMRGRPASEGEAFLKKAYVAAQRLGEMLEACRGKTGRPRV